MTKKQELIKHRKECAKVLKHTLNDILRDLSTVNKLLEDVFNDYDEEETAIADTLGNTADFIDRALHKIGIAPVKTEGMTCYDTSKMKICDPYAETITTISCVADKTGV